MRSHPLASQLSPLLALLILSGCNTAYREALSQAKEAAARGDFMTAARAYRSACAASPDDEVACTRVPIFAEKATTQAIAAARPPCESGDLDRCIPPLLDSLDLIPQHPEATAMLEKASQLHTERCTSKWKAEGSLNTEVAGLACLQSRGHQFRLPSYQALLSERATRLASRFAELATTARNKGTPGAAAVLWSTAQCLAPDPGTLAWSQQTYQEFLTQSAIPVATRLDGSIAPQVASGLTGLCQRLSSGLPPWARCAEAGTVPGQPMPLELQVDAIIQRVVENVSEDLRSVNYISGTRRVRNPAYHTAEERLEHAERSYRRADKMRNYRDEACDKEKKTHDAGCVGCTDPNDKNNKNKKTACDEARELHAAYDSAAQELGAARTNLSNTPEFMVEEVHDTFTYSVLTHRWSSGFRFTLQTNTPGAPAPAPQQGELRFQDQEHVGFSPAKIQADPLEVPNPWAYSDAFLRELAPHVFAAVQQDGRVRGAQRRTQCAELPANWSTPWVQCWAEATLWEGGQEPQPNGFLQLLASNAGASEQPMCR
ncbi:hypothetical protein [Vitiosangium sp. GDMCC 1.1324]|uniref:hypothetical protein n=1 Tax=Vitiosangium sp. (strain GDMCC 1.1324) TaxID=2138576 RepID=UPI000D3470A2|nr:hypothetical protein [Vitiosangium sp. GDMCC 1.1324]PTL82774.1 hypothetical protein DAT35_18590 [Vitiosangium sp. GDMCC 1.1324]